MAEITLKSVNWEHGMLLSPDHFVRQERYMDSLILWKLRYTTSEWGLVGGGPRLTESEHGSVRHDPIIALDQDEHSIAIAITQVRGITPGGHIIEIQPDHPIAQRFAKTNLAGVAESLVYVVCMPDIKEPVDGQTDELNPQMQTERLPSYRIAMQLHASEAERSIPVARIRRPNEGAGYEKDGGYIPPCTTLVAYSELTAAWRSILETTVTLANRYAELYRAMQEFLVLFEERGIETQSNHEAAAFVERVMLSLQDTVYEILDPMQVPAGFVRRMRHFLRSTAALLGLTPSVQQYLVGLSEAGVTEFIELLTQQKQLTKTSRLLRVHDNLAVEAQGILQSLRALQQLESALEGKYIDFRVSHALEGMNFIFDRGGKVLYRLAAKPARVQGRGEELIIYFSTLRLEGREKYRLILVGEPKHHFEVGTRISAEIRLNEGSGFRREPIHITRECALRGQCNFELDFDAVDVPTITEVRVIVASHHAIRTALLFTRHRFYGMTDAAASTTRVTPMQQSEVPMAHGSAQRPYSQSGQFGQSRLSTTPVNHDLNHSASSGSTLQRLGESEGERYGEDRPAPWEQRGSDPLTDLADHTKPTPTRRRRLE